MIKLHYYFLISIITNFPLKGFLVLFQQSHFMDYFVFFFPILLMGPTGYVYICPIIHRGFPLVNLLVTTVNEITCCR